MKSNIIFFLIIILTISTFSCDKENEEMVAYVPVNLRLELYNELAIFGVNEVITITPDSSRYLDGSVIKFYKSKTPNYYLNQRLYGNGIVIYREDFNSYRAYDLTCTYKPLSSHCPITVEGRSVLPVCPCCGSVFLLMSNGLPSNGSKARYPLKEYNTIITNNGTRLIISN